MPKTDLQTELDRLLRLALFEPEEATAGYQRLSAANPGDLTVQAQYAWHLNEYGDPDTAFAMGRKLLEKAPGLPQAHFLLAFGNSMHGRYEDALEGFAGVFAAVPPPHLPDGPYMYFNFLVMKVCGFDPGAATTFTEAFFGRHPELVANGTRDVIGRLQEQRIKQVYVQEKSLSGFVLFVDLVGSTQYKRDFPELWPDRIVHFLMYTKYAFQTVGYDFIKFIGDEVMLFRPFRDGDKAAAAFETFRFIFSRHGWYLAEVNRFNPALKGAAHPEKSPHRIKVKLTLGEVRNAKVFHPYYDATYDLIGSDVDRVARIKEMGHEDLVIVDEGFFQALSESGPACTEAMSDLRWRQKFKGIDEEVRFYGRSLK